MKGSCWLFSFFFSSFSSVVFDGTLFVPLCNLYVKRKERRLRRSSLFRVFWIAESSMRFCNRSSRESSKRCVVCNFLCISFVIGLRVFADWNRSGNAVSAVDRIGFGRRSGRSKMGRRRSAEPANRIANEQGQQTRPVGYFMLAPTLFEISNTSRLAAIRIAPGRCVWISDEYMKCKNSKLTDSCRFFFSFEANRLSEMKEWEIVLNSIMPPPPPLVPPTKLYRMYSCNCPRTRPPVQEAWMLF